MRRNSSSDQRLLNCGALRAFLRPAFLRSMTRASRVSSPAFFSDGAVGLFVDRVQAAGHAEAQGAGLAGDATAVDAGDDVEAALELEVANGSFTTCWCSLFGK